MGAGESRSYGLARDVGGYGSVGRLTDKCSTRHSDLLPDMGGTETRRTVVNFPRYKTKLCAELEIQRVRASELRYSVSVCVFCAGRLRCDGHVHRSF